MGTSLLVVALVAASGVGQSIRQEAIDTQNQAFQRWWGTDFEWKFDELPKEATVSAQRVPYSGYIYPDTAGGTANSLRKYDRAFHSGRLLATSHEQWDTTAFRKPTTQVVRGGLFGGRVSYRTVYTTPHWYGHCNGWSAAAIRHAEPRRSVVRNGVSFTPADIKALLAEIYMYNDTLMLDGDGSSINPGILHAAICNWIGRGLHPIAMEADPGDEKWNYPIYAYGTNSYRYGANRVEVRLSIYYAANSNGEYQQSPRLRRTRYFHYELDLDNDGNIVGGSYYRDSSRIDMLWVPLSPKQPGQPGNERGNPHVDVDEVLAIWRDSVDTDIRRNWAIVDPPKEDRLFSAEQLADDQLAPTPEQPVAAAETEASETDAADADPATVAAETPAPTETADADASEPAPAATEATADDETPAESTPAVPAEDAPAAAPAEGEPAPAPTPDAETPDAETPDAETPDAEPVVEETSGESPEPTAEESEGEDV